VRRSWSWKTNGSLPIGFAGVWKISVHDLLNASAGDEAIRKVEADSPDLILMDIVLKGKMDGIEATTGSILSSISR